MLSFDSFALIILKDIIMRSYCTLEEEGVVRIEEMLLKKAPRFMPSKVGAFEESVLIGMCFASDWAEQNKDLILGDELRAKEQLFSLHSAADYVYKGTKRITCKDKRSLEEIICTGFRQGISFGYKIKNLSVSSQMTTDKVLETFELLRQNPILVSKIISARAPSSILAQERICVKTID
ncbi:MAG: hypothetical protein IKV03_02535 [Alphaproteobacteria bacterium]|jgi:hypothetical protein|nr:hypothetical protein [Alphaproteobacteria bacterium]